MSEQDEARVRVLPLDDDHYTSKEIKDTSDSTLQSFTQHQTKNAYNEQKMHETVTKNTPLAVIRCRDTNFARDSNREHSFGGDYLQRQNEIKQCKEYIGSFEQHI
jgi:hypothetical protein